MGYIAICAMLCFTCHVEAPFIGAFPISKKAEMRRENMSDKDFTLKEQYLFQEGDHIVCSKVIDIVDNKQYSFVIGEYIGGRVLSDLLSEQGAMTDEATVELGIRLAGALQCLHNSVPPYIYRDMKPANVLITSLGDVKLIDSGIMMEYNPHQTGEVVHLGTRGYAAPELYSGDRPIDLRADIYGLGATLRQCATGIAPYYMPEANHMMEQPAAVVSKKLEHIISKCMAADPDERYQSCAELIVDLQSNRCLSPKTGLLAKLFGKK